MLDLYEVVDGKKMRLGYTTGSCATAAAKAAALILESGEIPKEVSIDTPAGIRLDLEVLNPILEVNWAQAEIKKDAGDDMDLTDGMEIFAKVKKRSDGEILIDGGEGIGRIQRKGLFGNVGDAAINPVPRKLIAEELRKISKSGYDVLIFAPKGEEIAKKTFNKNIGIIGGISIIGTRGIVYPMSEDAYKKTISLELHAVKENDGTDSLMLVPGAHGTKTARSWGIDTPSVEMSNFVGFALSNAYSEGFKNLLIVGHIGKLCKVAIGIFQTHNRTADTRMEAFVYYLAIREAPISLLREVSKALTAEEACEIVIAKGYESIFKDMKEGICSRVKTYLKDEEIFVNCRMYSMKRGEL